MLSRKKSMTFSTPFKPYKREISNNEREVNTMTPNQYQTAAMRTSSKTILPTDHLINGALGLAGESGEVADIVKKVMFQGHKIDKEHLAKELGDICWYLAETATAIGYDLETIMQMNIDKLMKRYPDGFSTERSQNREEGDI
jgi:NTP pyrophosphatase (non-canonical NTP hydrolase)